MWLVDVRSRADQHKERGMMCISLHITRNYPTRLVSLVIHTLMFSFLDLVLEVYERYLHIV
jgi:hypothetical protein